MFTRLGFSIKPYLISTDNAGTYTTTYTTLILNLSNIVIFASPMGNSYMLGALVTYLILLYGMGQRLLGT